MSFDTYAEVMGEVRHARTADRNLAAIVLLRFAEKRWGLTGFGRYELADALRVIGRRAEAEKLFDSIAMEDVPPGKLWLLMLHKGQLFVDGGEFEKGESFFREAARLKPDSTVPWVFLASALSRLERFSDACDALRLGLKASGDLDEVYLNLGYNLRTMGDYQGAKSSFEEALRITKSYPEAEKGLEDVTEALKVTAFVEAQMEQRNDSGQG